MRSILAIEGRISCNQFKYYYLTHQKLLSQFHRTSEMCMKIWRFWGKNEAYNVSICEIIDSEKRGYLNVKNVLFKCTLQQSSAAFLSYCFIILRRILLVRSEIISLFVNSLTDMCYVMYSLLKLIHKIVYKKLINIDLLMLHSPQESKCDALLLLLLLQPTQMKFKQQQPQQHSSSMRIAPKRVNCISVIYNTFIYAYTSHTYATVNWINR